LTLPRSTGFRLGRLRRPEKLARLNPERVGQPDERVEAKIYRRPFDATDEAEVESGGRFEFFLRQAKPHPVTMDVCSDELQVNLRTLNDHRRKVAQQHFKQPGLKYPRLLTARPGLPRWLRRSTPEGK
jgi:hypothetical protein